MPRRTCRSRDRRRRRRALVGRRRRRRVTWPRGDPARVAAVGARSRPSLLHRLLDADAGVRAADTAESVVRARPTAHLTHSADPARHGTAGHARCRAVRRRIRCGRTVPFLGHEKRHWSIYLIDSKFTPAHMFDVKFIFIDICHFFDDYRPRNRLGRSDGGYIGIYTPRKKNQSTLQIFMCLLVVLFTCVTLTCFDFEIGMTS